MERLSRPHFANAAPEPGEPGGKVAAVVELMLDGVGAERSVDGAVALIVVDDEFGPAMMEGLPQGRGRGDGADGRWKA